SIPIIVGGYEYCGPDWLRRLWPKSELQIFDRAICAIVPANVTDEEAKDIVNALRSMPYVRKLYLNDIEFAFRQMGPLSDDMDRWLSGDAYRTPLLTTTRFPNEIALTNIQEIELNPEAAQFDEGHDVGTLVCELAGDLPRLRTLSLSGFHVYAEALKSLAKSRSLVRLDLSGAHI